MKVTFIGHSTCLLEIAGKRILTDPVWAKRIFFIKRLQEPGMTMEEALPIDMVLLSHAHFDHLHVRTIKKLDRSTPIICAKHMAKLFYVWGFSRIYELDWWQMIEVDGLKITAVPAEHFGGRWQFWDKLMGYSGYVIGTDQKQIYFAGDTGYGDFFKTIGELFKLQVALLPIAAYAGPGKIDFHDVHMNPENAVQAFKDLQAEHFVPIHFGAFRLSTEPIEEPEQWLREVAQEYALNGQLRILEPGQTFEIKS